MSLIKLTGDIKQSLDTNNTQQSQKRKGFEHR